MKKMIVLAALFITSLTSFAGFERPQFKFPSGKQYLFNLDTIPGKDCTDATQIIFDESALMGKIVRLNEFIHGRCKRMVRPNTRFAQVIHIESVGCGSQKYRAVGYSSKGAFELEIIDHRTRHCRDMVRHIVIVKEVSGDKETTRYQKLWSTYEPR